MVNKVHPFGSFVAWGPTHGDFDLRVFCEDGIDVGTKEDGSILGWVRGGVENHLQGRGGVTIKLNLCDRGTIVELPVDKV